MDQDCAVSPADRKIACIVSTTCIFSRIGARRDKSLTPATVLVDMGCEAPVRSNTDCVVAKELPSSINALYMTIIEPLCKRGISKTIVRSQKKCCMDTSIKAPATNVIDEDVFNVIESVESSHLSPESVAARGSLLPATKTVCCSYNEDFKTYAKRANSKVDNIWPRASNYSSAVLCIMYAASRTFKTATITCSMRRKWSRIASLKKNFETWRAWTHLLFRRIVFHLVTAFLLSNGRSGEMPCRSAGVWSVSDSVDLQSWPW